MKIFAPSYYNKFSCIKDKCKNNCCIGWEIDVDGDTLSEYKKKEDIIKHISLFPTPHFILGENERCPFLDNDNLCYIIKKYGESCLCQICDDHPRFRSFFGSREEIGLGLCCEAAAEIILENDFNLITLYETDEEVIIDEYQEELLKERENFFCAKIYSLKDFLPNITLKELHNFLFSLERLDKDWDAYLEKLNRNISIKDVQVPDAVKATRLFHYFIFRHYHEYSFIFCLVCTFLIIAIGGDI